MRTRRKVEGEKYEYRLLTFLPGGGVVGEDGRAADVNALAKEGFRVTHTAHRAGAVLVVMERVENPTGEAIAGALEEISWMLEQIHDRLCNIAQRV